MKQLSIFVLNGLKKTLACFKTRRTSGVKNPPGGQSVREPAVTVTGKNACQAIRLQEVAVNVKAIIGEYKLYKNPTLALRELSDRLNMPSYIVSKAINEVLGANFYDLVNKYRVEEAKLLLTNPWYDRYTILRVASDAGFNSKTTFNVVFRKFTGVTPSYYRTTCRMTSDVHNLNLVTHSKLF